MRLFNPIGIATLAFLSLLLASCLLGPQSKRGSVVDNELRVGIIYTAEGNPAVNARVRVFPVDHLPDTLADTGTSASGDRLYSTRTDENGKYKVGTLPDGEYNILAEQSGLVAIQDSVYLDKTTGSVPADTLSEPGSLSGVIRLQINHDPRYAIVQVLGTHSYANVDSQGRFRLEALAAGRYNLRVFVSLPEYNTLFKSITISSGKADSLKDTLVPPFLGIPVVQGLRGSFDTLNSVVSLSWNAVSFRDFAEYQIFRDEVPVLELSGKAVAATMDTVFRDSLSDLLNKASDSKTYEYRIRVKDKSDHIGLSYGNIKIQTTPWSLVRTEIGLRLKSVTWDSAHQVDSVEVVATLHNSTRKLIKMSWVIGKQEDRIPEEDLGGIRDVEKTLRYGWDKEGSYSVFATVEDEAGTVQMESILIPGNSAPALSGSPDSIGKAYLPYMFAPIATDADNDKLRFSIVNKPVWAAFDTLTGSLSGTPENSHSGTYRDIVISVTDGRRVRKTPSFKIRIAVNPWSQGPKWPVKSGRVEGYAIGDSDRIYAIGDSIWSLDADKAIWIMEAPVPDELYTCVATVINGKILMFSMTGSFPDRKYHTQIYDPLLKAWKSGAPFPVVHQSLFQGVALDQVFYTVNAGQMWAYDSRLDVWTRKKDPPEQFTLGGLDNARCSVLNGKILVMGLNYAEDPSNKLRAAGLVGLYDPSEDAWEYAAPIIPRVKCAIGSIGGKVYIAGGETREGYISRTEEYDPASGTWKEKTPMPQAINVLAYAQSKNRLFVFQRILTPLITDKSDETWIYDPSLDP